MADDRIIMRLVNTLGKIFYKSSKRPIPVRIAEIEKVDGKKVKKDPKQKNNNNSDEKSSAFASPLIVAKEIEKALSCAPVQLAPATTASIRIGSSKFTSEQLAQNVEAVVKGLTEKFITKGWRNIKAIHVKGASTMAMPIWLASELWVDENDVLENNAEETKAIEGGKKRKSTGDDEKLLEDSKKSKKPKATEDDDEAASLAARKQKLQQQKEKALEDGKASISQNTGNATKAGKKKRKSTT